MAGLEGFLERPTLKETSLVLQQHWPWERWQPTEVGERRDVDFSLDLSDFGIQLFSAVKHLLPIVVGFWLNVMLCYSMF